MQLQGELTEGEKEGDLPEVVPLEPPAEEAMYVYKNYDPLKSAQRGELRAKQKKPKWAVEEDLVISGMSGRFPESDSIEEFKSNLYGNVDMVVENDRRWPYGFMGLGRITGKLKDISRFDNRFFHVTEKEANFLDAQVRIMLEITFEALWDAGLDPACLAGSQTGVFLGHCYDEFMSAYSRSHVTIPDYRQCFFGMLANVFDFRGPSKHFDSACASGLTALHEAIISIRSGECERAIILGLNVALCAEMQVKFVQMNMISPDGHCKCLDDDANGYAKGEACVAVILQRRSEAKRIYATVVHTKTNCDGYKDLGITFPSFEMQRDLIEDTYAEAQLSPLLVDYCEAHCTGTQAGDPSEMRAITESMCRGRTKPLLIGAIKSVIGHTEGVSGLCSLVKTLLSFENELIPANLHMSKPNHRIDGLVSGILQPVITNTPFTGEYIALNSFGFGGVNVHAIIQKHGQETDLLTLEKSKGSLPRLVVFCGRNPETLAKFADFLQNNAGKLTPGYLSLLNDVSKTSPFRSRLFKGMRHRGFMLLAGKEGSPEEGGLFPVSQLVANKVKDTEKAPPLCFVFTGSGCQWAAMGAQLTAFPIICSALNLCTQVLQSLEPSLDLMAIITDTSGEALKRPLNAFVAIAAIQIGLVDLLTQLGLTADYIVGHSVGELSCAYADGCLSLEETISCAYWRGKAVEDLKKKEEEKEDEGTMAAIGCTWEEATEWCTTLSGGTVWPACHNGEDSVTVSGQRENVEAFLAKLRQANGDIFTQIVDSSRVAFHSPLVEGIRGPLLCQVNQLLASKPRSRKISSRWIGSTYEVGEENETLDGAYLVDNLILPVRFHEALQKVPGNAVFLEIGPHHLLQAIIKRTLLSSAAQSGPVKYVATLSRGKDNVISLLSCLGQLYGHGYSPAIESLYPKVVYPVARNTAPLHSAIQWCHDRSFTVTQYPDFFNPEKLNKFETTFDLQHADDKYLSGHCVNGRILFPTTGYLFLVWRSLAQHLKRDWKEMPVIFEDVKLHRATLMPKSGVTHFEVSFLQGVGHFAIKVGGIVTTTGKISVPPAGEAFLKHQGLLDSIGHLEGQTATMEMKSKDIYKELRLRGYDYGPDFQAVQSIRLVDQCVTAKVLCQNWVTFVDGLLQLAILGQANRALYLPVQLGSLRCDPRELFKNGSEEAGPKPIVDALVDGALNIGVAAGIEYHGIRANLAQRKIAQAPLEETVEFVAHQELALPYTASRAFSEKRCQGMTAQLKVYEQVCSQLLEHPNNGLEAEEWSQFESKYESDVSSPVLLRLLRQMVAQPKDMPPEGEAQLEALEDDLLFRTYQTERFLRPQLEIACEQLQTTATTLQVLEVNQTPTILASSLLHLLRLSSSKAIFNYLLLHSGLEKFQSTLDLDSTHSQHAWLAEKSTFPTDIAEIDLMVYKDSSTCPLLAQATVNFDSLLAAMWSALSERGFALLLLREAPFQVERHLARLLGKELPSAEEEPSRVATLDAALEKSPFTVMSHKSDAFGVHAYLLRKLSAELVFEEQIFLPVSKNVSDWLTPVQEAIRKLNKEKQPNNTGRVWLLANEATSGVIGFLTCLYKEPLGGKVRAILNTDPTSELTVHSPVIKEILKLDLSTNVLSPGGRLGTYRRFTLPAEDHEPTPVEHAFLNVATRGDLSSLQWYESAHKYWPLNRQTGEQSLCTVYYSGLNFKDIMLATGKLPPDAKKALDECILGLEFAGRDANGERCMGVVFSKGLATTLVMNDASFLCPIPPHWSMEEAATVPVAYSTAYYALLIRGKLQQGESVLIHSASGAVGQASITLCLSLNCRLFITVGSDAKRDVLLSLFPQLKPNQFASSRNTDFSRQILQATGGKGVDVILNSLADEKLQASVDCLAEFGRFLEIGKYDMSENNPLDLSKIMQNKTFHGIQLDTLFNPESASKLTPRYRRMLVSYFTEGMASGVVRPLERTIFTVEQSEEAFRYMTTGKHTGKVILCIRPEETPGKGGVVKIDDSLKIPAIPRTIFLTHKSYIITGGLGGVGLELIDWMIHRMARQFVVTSRTGVKDLYQRTRLDYFASVGATVRIFTQDASTLSGAQGLIAEAERMGPIGGVFHLALVLHDALFDNQTLESFETAVSPKGTTLAHLDGLTRKDASKPAVDYFVAFSSLSSGLGIPGQSNYGFGNSVMERICEQRRSQGLHGLAIQWGPIGDVGYIMDHARGNDFTLFGGIPQRIPSCLAVLDRLLQTSFSVCSSLLKVDTSLDVGGRASLIKTVAHILGLKDYTTLDKASTLSELGMDSLMGVEVKQAIERDYDVILKINDIRKLTIGEILEIGSGKGTRTEEGAPSQEGAQGGLTDEMLMPSVALTYLNDIVNGEPIIFLPPLNRSFELMRPLAGKLNRPAIGLNWTSECQHLQTLPAAAAHFIDVLERALPQLEDNYDVIGYSFGGLLAIEMAIQLHARRNSATTSRLGPCRNLILLDSSPKQFNIFVNEASLKFNVNNWHTEEAYTDSIFMVLATSLSIDMGKLREQLFALEDIPKRIAFARDLFKQVANCDIALETMRSLIQSHHNKMLMLNSYDCPPKGLPGNLMLIRASQTLVKDTAVDIREDYWLGESITGKCQVHILQGNHTTFITDNYPQLIELVQQYFQ